MPQPCPAIYAFKPAVRRADAKWLPVTLKQPTLATMMRRLTSLLLLFLLAGPPLLRATELIEGMSQAEVEGLLGKPNSVLHRGKRTLLLYPQKGRVEFEEGRAVLFSNVHAPTSGSVTTDATNKPGESSPAAEKAQAKATTQATADAAAKSTGIPTSKAFAPAKSNELTEDDNSEIARQQAALADSLTRLSEKPGSLDSERPTPAVGFWTSLLVECVVRILVTVVVLKLAFRWADVHADWGQMWLPALADSLTRAGIAAAALHFWHTTELLHIDDGVSYFVLLLTLMRTTHACTLPRAVAVAMAAKLASLVIWVLLAAVLLSLLT